MQCQVATPPSIEPITLSELKAHLQLDSGTFDGNLTLTQSLAYGSHAIANNYTTHVGTGVDVLGKEVDVILHCGTNGATGTNDTIIQESDDNITYADWTGGPFTQVTTSNDNADYKKQYTGAKRYIRTASKVLLAACEFGTSILVNAAVTAQDDLLTELIKSAREDIEAYTRRQLLTATWDYYLNEFPNNDFIPLPFGNLQSVTSIKWTDSDGTEATLTENTDYIVETNGEGIGRIVLPDGASWPSGTLYPSKPIAIRYICGWTAAASLPSVIRTACKFQAENLHLHGGDDQTLTKLVNNLLYSLRLWNEF